MGHPRFVRSIPWVKNKCNALIVSCFVYDKSENHGIRLFFYMYPSGVDLLRLGVAKNPDLHLFGLSEQFATMFFKMSSYMSSQAITKGIKTMCTRRFRHVFNLSF